MRQIAIYLFLLIAMTSCFEEDEMVPPHNPGNLMVGEVELTETYKYQVFFDLETNTSVRSNLISAWDLGFEASDSGWHVILNTSKMMLAGNTGLTDFESVTKNPGIEMNFDPSDGNLDSTAIGQWYGLNDREPFSHGHVYIVDRGIDENYNQPGLKKVVFDLHDRDTYLVRFADLDGKNEQTVTIPKNDAVNFVCLSFDNGVVDIEPGKNEWDLQFGKYSTLLFTNDGQPYPYLVTGVQLNPNQTLAVMDTTYAFDEINLEIAEELPLISQKDVIGYEWKVYDFDNAVYTVLPDKLYILKDTEGYFYKLRFIDYYNQTGEQGYPAFEFLRL